MGEAKLQSGDFLEDIEFNIILRSGSTDLGILRKLIQVIVTSVTSSVDTKVVTIETEEKVNQNGQRTLRVVSKRLYIE